MKRTEKMAVASPEKTIEVCISKLESQAQERKANGNPRLDQEVRELKAFLMELWYEEMNLENLASVNSLASLESVLEKLIREVLALVDSLPGDLYDRYLEHDSEFFELLAKRCGYLIKIKKLQKRRQELLDEMISTGSIKGVQLYRLIRRYRRDKGRVWERTPIDRYVAQPDGTVKEEYPIHELWRREVNGEELRYLEDALEDLRELEGEDFDDGESDDGLSPVERQIREIERIIKTEVGARVAIDELVVQYPDHEKLIRKRLKETIDALREGEL